MADTTIPSQYDTRPSHQHDNTTPTPAQQSPMSLDTVTMNLEDHRIPGLPPSFYYIPNFVTRAEEEALIAKITSSRYITLPTSHRRLQVYPAPLSNNNVLLADKDMPSWLTESVVPRMEKLGVFGDTKHGKPNHCLVNEYEPGRGIMPHEDGGAYADVVATVSLGGAVCLDVCEKANDTGEAGAVDDAGGGGADGDEDAGTRERLSRTTDKATATTTTPRKWRILQEPRSLLVTRGAAYKELLHGIDGVERDENVQEVVNWEMLGHRDRFEEAGRVNVRSTRISLTFRDVLKVVKVGARLFGRR